MSKTKIALLVSGAPYGQQGASSAYQFCHAALQSGHEIVGVFFYQEGVLNSSYILSPATDEVNLQQLWCDLATQYQFPLEVCVSAALRRGIVDSVEAEQLALSHFNLKPPFALSGLGQLAELSAKSDRLVQFL
ncbi:intracellular sulfur oxidation protein of DsrE family protein [Psychromonas sp. CNPT3]|uniref:sulfurtransferase complex subunit TusD n=1 Tax=Psychromonas sp. CNPT3 TaxID=314282 RepID=UPI00006E9E4C|nr:sulfurtransferase complex subunit TusD [Psychromonas sp. CNPT3]AGH82334.1 intracellular sulfur oxidation protein of DsrE family protein [Psychromonas sp. CNPT3]